MPMLTDDDIDRIGDKTKLIFIDLQKADKEEHLKTDHAPLTESVNTAHKKINSLQKTLAYATGFAGAIILLINLFG